LATTNDGNTALSLAKSTATASHPNYALIKALEGELQLVGGGVTSLEVAPVLPARVGSTDTIDKTPKRSGKTQPNSRKRQKASTRAHAAKRTVQTGSGLSVIETPAAANLLLHFSRNSNATVKFETGEPEMEVEREMEEGIFKTEESEMEVVAV
jgi:hypothetical protein